MTDEEYKLKTKYCVNCGRKMALYHTGYYNEETGEPEFGCRCPSWWCRSKYGYV